MTVTDRTLRHISLDRLVPWTEHPRKTPAESAAFKQLKASIAAHGLLENLLVHAIGKDDNRDDRYEVVAGARRLAALQALAGEGAISQVHPVPCHVLPADSPVEVMCVVENMVRTALHPADRFEALAKHIRAGGTVPEIAATLKVSTKKVEQWLRLGEVAPEILDAYRVGEIGIKSLKALCFTSNTQRQQSIWEKLKAEHNVPGSRVIWRLVTNGCIHSSARAVRFVGLPAYEAAGGTLIHNIFAETDDGGIWLEDAALLNKLARDRLEATAEELRAEWSWVEVREQVNRGDTALFAHVHPIPGELTEDEIKEYDRLLVQRDDLAELDQDEWNEEAESESERVETRLEELRRLEDVGRAVFRRKDMEIAGAIVTIGDDYTVRVIQGLVRPEDIFGPDAHPAELCVGIAETTVTVGDDGTLHVFKGLVTPEKLVDARTGFVGPNHASTDHDGGKGR
ncbi:MAG: ParB/RepB/Spo0J family partition protein [Rhodospirillaceae bacterium]|nr:ParB/RepB/Spo0J family partition protein [Rhodospirillaceae bacterium]